MTVPNIDEIFESGREPTEEEWKAWAEAFVPKHKPTEKVVRELHIKRRTTKQLKQKESKRKAYKEKDKYKSWGRKYNEKRKYLLKYNKQWAENFNYTTSQYLYREETKKYDSWYAKYKRTYKYKLTDHANTFKIGENEYVYGFTQEQIIQMSPFSRERFKKFTQEELIIPLPVYEGKKFENKKLSKKSVKFYVLTEAKALLDTIAQHKKKVGTLQSEDQKLFLKKAVWEAVLTARQEFENDRKEEL